MLERTLPQPPARPLSSFLPRVLTRRDSAEFYRDERPALDLFSYFKGDVDAWGHFANRSGRVVRRFRVAIRGRVEHDTLTLDESFTYSDASTSRRVWTIRRLDEHRFLGIASDVAGVADGVVYGNAFHWRYTLNLPVGRRTVVVDFDDWMYLQDGGTVLLNKSVMSKFGFRLGEVVLAFTKRTTSPA